MLTQTQAPAGHTLVLSDEERDQLIAFLEQALRAKEIEVHRTDAPDYRKLVEREETILQNILGRLRR